MEPRKFILDTDIGDDIDDALALAFGIAEPGLRLLGVTTAFHDTQKRGRIAKKLLHLWGAPDIPVYAGIQGGGSVNFSYLCQYTPDLEQPEYEPLSNAYTDGGAAAIDFILDMARTYGKELTLIPIGPLTNIAAAIRKDPSAMKSLGGILLMGGCFSRPCPEWNILCDPEAARTVLESGCAITCVGLDVTRETRLSDAQQHAVTQRQPDEKREYLAGLIRLHQQVTKGNSILHDPLTVYSLAHPDILTTEALSVRVEADGPDRGLTKPDPTGSAPVSVAKTVDAPRFLADFIQTVFA